MTQAKALRVSFAAVFTCGLLVALVTLPFAALPIAYIGLTMGLTAAALTAGLASVLLGALAGSGTALSFIISFGVPILWLIRLALLSRRQSLDTDYEFYPAAQIILQAVIISAALAASFFWSMPMFPRASRHVCPKPAKRTASFRIDPHGLWHRHKSFGCRQYYSDNGVCQLAAYFAGHAAMRPSACPYSGNNLRPAETHDRLKMPIWFDFALGLSLLGAWVASDWPATLSAVFAAILIGAYFLLGLAVIHAISRHWNGRVWFLAGLYFLIFVMAWVIVPISLLGLLSLGSIYVARPHSPEIRR